MCHKCKGCGKSKIDGAVFGPHKASKNGLRSRCNECRRKKYQENRELILKKAKIYYQENKNEIKEKHKKYFNTKAGKEARLRGQRKQRVNYPHKVRAQSQINNELKMGRIIRPTICSLCGCDCTPDGHHWDYDKPLDVVWVCRQCHCDIHNDNLKNC